MCPLHLLQKSGNPISKKFAHYEKLKGRALANKYRFH